MHDCYCMHLSCTQVGSVSQEQQTMAACCLMALKHSNAVHTTNSLQRSSPAHTQTEAARTGAAAPQQPPRDGIVHNQAAPRVQPA